MRKRRRRSEARALIDMRLSYRLIMRATPVAATTCLKQAGKLSTSDLRPLPWWRDLVRSLSPHGNGECNLHKLHQLRINALSITLPFPRFPLSSLCSMLTALFHLPSISHSLHYSHPPTQIKPTHGVLGFWGFGVLLVFWSKR